jgi:dihydrolipoamide dehydrogenase
MQEKYGIVFLGGGPAGYQGAIRAAQLGSRAAVIEQRFVGGVCLNQGCIPTKTVRASAETGRAMRRAKEYGFNPVEVLPDMGAIIARKQRVVNMLRNSIEQLFRARSIDLIEGRGVLVGAGRVEVRKNEETKTVEATKVVICTGSRPAELPMFPKSPRIFLADDIFNISYLPKHLLVVGGGAVGVEMASIFRELGSQISLVETLDRILPHEDTEMSSHLLSILQRRKIKVHCGVAVETVTETEEGFTVRLSNGAELAPDTILQAVGRRFNTEEIGLEHIGITTEDGRIPVNECLQTSAPNVYAAGDVIGGWLLAHVAFAEGICAAEHALGMESRMDYRAVPRCVFSIPEYAAVGLSEQESQSSYPVRIGRFPFKSQGMAHATGEPEGLGKVIAHEKTDEILGAHIIGSHGADLIAEMTLAMQTHIPARILMKTIHTHPTFSEAVQETALALHGQAIHTL